MKIRVLFGIIAVLSAAMFTIAGCDPGGPSGKDPIIIKGILSDNGGHSTQSMARNINARSSSNFNTEFSGTVQSNNTITGKLKDGGMIFLLEGLYEPSTKAFSMQAASSFMVFSISGQLANNNTIDSTQSHAFVHVKEQGQEEWATIKLDIIPSNVNVSEPVTETAPELPEWVRGVWYDQFLFYSMRITNNAIYIEGEPLTIVGFEEVGNNVELIIREIFGVYDDTTNELINEFPYTARFLVSNSIDSFTDDIKNVTIRDISFGFTDEDTTLSETVSTWTGQKMFFAPYCSSANVYKDDPEFVIDGYSPFFIDDTSATTHALAATIMKPIPGFTLALKRTAPQLPPVGKLTITGLGAHNDKFVFGETEWSEVLGIIDASMDNAIFLEQLGGKVVGGQVELNVIRQTNQGPRFGYQGNDTLTFNIYIGNSANTDWVSTFSVGTVTADFENGIGTGEFKPFARLTITGLSTHNGKYAMGQYYWYDDIEEEYYTLNAGVDGSTTAGLIQGGTVTLPVRINGFHYAGSEEFTIKINIYTRAEGYNSGDSPIDVGWVTVKFQNGGIHTANLKSPAKLTITGLAEFAGKDVSAACFAGDSCGLMAVGPDYREVIISASGTVTLNMFVTGEGYFNTEQKPMVVSVSTKDPITGITNPIGSGQVMINFADGSASIVYRNSFDWWLDAKTGTYHYPPW